MQNTNKNITIRSQLEHLCQYKYIDFEHFAQFSSNIMRIQNYSPTSEAKVWFHLGQTREFISYEGKTC